MAQEPEGKGDHEDQGGAAPGRRAGGADFALRGSLWMTVAGQDFGGPGRIALLASIGATGSISQAAKRIGMSYKSAWDAIDAMNNLAGEALVERLTGGKGGGGTRLTARGAQLVRNFGAIEQIHHEFVARLNRQAGGIADDLALINRLNMKTSARNQFYGTISQVQRGVVNDEITLDIAGGHRIVAIVTHESTEQLGLRPGAQAVALVKASSVILMANLGNAGKAANEADEGAVRFSARNYLTGEITRITPGALNAEVVIALPGGGSITAIVTADSATALGLAEGGTVGALFKASSVIVGVPA